MILKEVHSELKELISFQDYQMNLSRLPVDLTLEKTYNADAASSRIGITHFTNSISARQRWALSHSMRIKVISKI